MKKRMHPFFESRLFIALIVLCYLLLTGLLVWLLLAHTRPQIEIMLTKLIPRTLWLNFLLLAFALAINRDRALFFKKKGSVPVFIAIAGVIFVALVAPQTHRIFYDEDIYANMAQNIACTGQAGMANYATFEYGEYFVHWLQYNKDPAGWSFLMSVVFQLFGVNETFAFYLNNALYGLGVIIVYWITALLSGGRRFPAMMAALVYALIPHNVIWSNTISAENAAAVFGGLAVLSALYWLKSREPRRLFLLATVLPFACNMRPESSLIVVVVLAAVAFNMFSSRKRNDAGLSATDGEPAGSPLQSGNDAAPPFSHPFATRTFWAMGLIPFALIIPFILHLYAMSGQSWGAEGAKFAVSFFHRNVAINGAYFFNNKEFPLIFTLFAIIGLLLWRRCRKYPEKDAGRTSNNSLNESTQALFRASSSKTTSEALCTEGFPVIMMLIWFFLFWGIFLFFYAGSYKYGADVRFGLLCFMPLAVMAGLGGEVFRGWLEGFFSDRLSATILLMLLLLICWLKFVPLIRTVGQEAWGARCDHRYAREFIKKIPNRSVVLTHVPTMFLLWGQNAIQAYAGINNPEIIQDMMKRFHGHVYFHKGYWCNANSQANRDICNRIADQYALELVAEAHEQTYAYALYRMRNK